MKTSITNNFPPVPVFAGLIAASLLIWYRDLWNTISLAARDDRYTHILLVLPISVLLFHLQWKEYREEARPSFRYAGLLLIIFALAGVERWRSSAAASDTYLTLTMLTLVTWWRRHSLSVSERAPSAPLYFRCSSYIGWFRFQRPSSLALSPDFSGPRPGRRKFCSDYRERPSPSRDSC